MLTEKETTQISKFLSLVLRHKPEIIGIYLEENGWVSVDELLEKMNAHGQFLTPEILEHVVATNSKKRFALNDDRTKIRASQGHSVEIDLGYSPAEPPEILYHGTAQHNVASILQHGLNKCSRQHVHLSADVATAIKVGQRYGKPQVLQVKSGQMYADGFIFYLSENGVWLTDEVPGAYIIVI